VLEDEARKTITCDCVTAPCAWDAGCLSPETDPLGGLGCAAEGVQACRFVVLPCEEKQCILDESCREQDAGCGALGHEGLRYCGDGELVPCPQFWECATCDRWFGGLAGQRCQGERRCCARLLLQRLAFAVLLSLASVLLAVIAARHLPLLAAQPHESPPPSPPPPPPALLSLTYSPMAAGATNSRQPRRRRLGVRRAAAVGAFGATSAALFGGAGKLWWHA